MGKAMRRLAFSVCSVVAGVALAQPPVDASNAQALARAIGARGAKAVVAELNAGANPNEWDRVMDRVAAGGHEWLEVARMLGAGTDAGASTDLEISLARALPRNAEGVLALADTQVFLAADRLCGAPFIEPGDAFLQRYLRGAREAVARVASPRLAQVRTRCLRALAAAQRTLVR